MRTQYKFLLSLLLTCFCLNLNAAPDPKDVAVVNTPSVTVINVPGVTIENDQLHPVPVAPKQYPREPFVLQGTFTFDTEVFVDVTMSPPAGKVAVIEMVTATFVLGINDHMRGVYLFTAPDGSELMGFILQPPTLRSTFADANDYYVSQQVRLYSAANWPVVFRVERNSTVFDGRHGVVRISGYSIPIDSPSLAP